MSPGLQPEVFRDQSWGLPRGTGRSRVNGDKLIEDARRATIEHKMSWRSFPNHRSLKGDISNACGCNGWPTFDLIDPDGIIRKQMTPQRIEAAILVDVGDLRHSTIAPFRNAFRLSHKSRARRGMGFASSHAFPLHRRGIFIIAGKPPQMPSLATHMVATSRHQ